MPAVSSVESYNGRVSLAYFPAHLRRALRIGLLAQPQAWGVEQAGQVFPLLRPAPRPAGRFAWRRRGPRRPPLPPPRRVRGRGAPPRRRCPPPPPPVVPSG